MRVCDGCGTKMPFGRRRTRPKAEGDERLLCNGCDPDGRGPGEGRPVGHHGMIQALAATGRDPIRSLAMQFVAHDSGDGETIYHCPFCFAAGARYITKDGIKSFGETAGTTQLVLTADENDRTGGRWVEAHIHEFGEQPIMEVTLKRNQRRRVVEATPEHRWLVKADTRVAGVRGRTTDRSVLTRDLKPEHRLSFLRPDGVGDLVPSDEGIRHGIVFGDGSAQGKRATVHIWGEKDKQLLRYFPDRRYKDVNTSTRVLGTGVPGVHVSGDLWAWMKAIPESDDSSYLYGWLAGYFAADGCVGKQGNVIINSANLSHLEAVRDIAIGLGISTYDITMKMRVGFVGREPSALYGLEFLGSTLNEGFFLIEEHRDRWSFRDYSYERFGWTVESVEMTDRVERVYCAVVPETHSFALEGNIWVGNCGGGQVTGRSDGTVECDFCKSSFTVQVQPQHPGAPQTVNGQPVEWPGQPEGSVDDSTFEQQLLNEGDDGDPVDSAAPVPEKVPEEKPKGKVPPQFASLFVTEAGAVLDLDSYVRHLAIRYADDPQDVIAEVRAERQGS